MIWLGMYKSRSDRKRTPSGAVERKWNEISSGSELQQCPRGFKMYFLI